MGAGCIATIAARQRSGDMAVITHIDDLRRLHAKRTPRMFYDYVDSGSWSESTYRANERDLARIKFRQRVLVNMENRSLRSQMIGQEVAMPVALAPTGLTGMQIGDGEILAARAAEAFGVPYTLSTMSICSIEEVAAATTKPFWFQLYVMRDRQFIERLIDRAKAAGCSALVLTLDLQILGQRHKDIRNGLSTPPKPTLANIVNLLTKPRWCIGMLGATRRNFGNLIGHVEGLTNTASLSAWSAQQLDPTLDWDDVEWVKRRWGGKLVLKGVLDAEDARRAVATGADALIVSNHGGRQLDGAVSGVELLPAVAAEVGDRLTLMVDGGFRRGGDVLKAIALGAHAVMIGRATLYGLAAGGEAGASHALELLRAEMDRAMLLLGCGSIPELGRHLVHS